MQTELNEAQRRAVETESSPVCILAGAGSGKTRVLTRRIAHRILTGSADPGHVLALTFTRKAAGELGKRLRQLGVRDHVAAGTFHAIAYAQLRRRWADRGEQAPVLLERKGRLLAPLLPGRRGSGAMVGSGSMVQLADVAAEIEWAKARMVTPDRYAAEAAAAGRTPPLPADTMATVYQRYEDEKRRKRVVDFDDLLVQCAHALETEAEFAAAQRWRFRHLFVDEFQDVNPVQYRLLEGWLGDRVDLCVVGDPNQAIYSWNGADPAYLTGFTTRFPGAEVVALTDNYRSTPQVLAVAGAVLGAVPMGAHQPEGAIPVVRSFATDLDEARGVARAVRRSHGTGLAWSHLAVLTRTNAQLVLFEEALRAADIPYRVRGGDAFLNQPEIREALAGLRTSPPGMSFAARLTDIERLAGDGDAPPERRLRLEALVRLGHEYLAADPSASAEGFLAWLTATVRTDQPDDGADVVELATFHRAKGLEWPVVFVAGLERGLVPIGQAKTDAAEAEERRLLYVAVTRAQRELHCSWAQRRTFGTRTVPRQPSPWLGLIDVACARLRGDDVPADRAVWANRAASERRKLRAGTPSPADEPVLAALKAWRSSTAKAANLPAYVVFHDSTLAAVAQARPRTRAELLALPGLGPVKVERYGDALIEVVARQAG
jgi:DNA helicase-2/ATP-dependent DNA helicase PcrA